MRQQPLEPDTFATAKEVSEYLKITDRTLRRYVLEGKIPAYRIGTKHIRFRVADVEALLNPIPGPSADR